MGREARVARGGFLGGMSINGGRVGSDESRRTLGIGGSCI